MRGSVLFVLGKLGEKKPSDNNTDVEKQGTHASDESVMMLKMAATSGDVEVLRNILHLASRKDKETIALASGDTLIMAIQNSHTEAAKLLIETKGVIFYQDSKGAKALYWAAKEGHWSICQALLLAPIGS